MHWLIYFFPVDEKCVTLQEKPREEGSDYINANFILVSAIHRHGQIFAGDFKRLTYLHILILTIFSI